MTNALPYRSWMLIPAILAVLVCMPSGAHARMIDGIVAVVDNKVIMDSDLRKRMVELGAPTDSRTAERQVLELMVEDIVIEKIYKSLGMPRVNENEASRAAKQMKCSIETARSYIMKSALMEMMVRSRVVITENMIRNFYDSRPEYKGRASVKLSQIVLSADEQKMQDLLDDIRTGKSFDGKGSAASHPGVKDIGWVPMDDLSDEIAKRLGGAKPGSVIGPVPAADGGVAYYKYMEKGVIGGRTLDDAKVEIQQSLEKKYQQEAFNYWLRKMMTQYFIGIYI